MQVSKAWKAAGAAIVGLGIVMGLEGAAGAASCQQSKLQAAGKKTAGKLGCHATAVKTGLGVSTPCLDKVELKFESTFTKADAKGGCPTPGDAATVEIAVDACVSSILSALGAGSPPPPPAACLQAKIKASGKKAAGKLKCWAKAAAKTSPVDPACLTKEETKFDLAFVKAELKSGCAQTGDAALVEAVVDSCVGNLVGLLPPPTTSTTTSTTTTSTTSTTIAVCGGSEPASLAGITAAQNDVRANASPTPSPPLDPLCWNSTVASTAQAWADACTWMHNPNLGTLGYGENIAAFGYPTPTAPTTQPLDAVDLWAAEVADYTYATNSCSGVCGHYTQLVWRATQSVGCGVRSCSTGSPFGPSFPYWIMVVCDYAPPGNVVGQWPY